MMVPDRDRGDVIFACKDHNGQRASLRRPGRHRDAHVLNDDNGGDRARINDLRDD